MKWNELGGQRLEGKEAADYACQDIYFLQHGNEHTHRVRRCFPPTETISIRRDGEPWTATSTYTQLLGSENTYRKMVAVCKGRSKCRRKRKKEKRKK